MGRHADAGPRPTADPCAPAGRPRPYPATCTPHRTCDRFQAVDPSLVGTARERPSTVVDDRLSGGVRRSGVRWQTNDTGTVSRLQRAVQDIAALPYPLCPDADDRQRPVLRREALQSPMPSTRAAGLLGRVFLLREGLRLRDPPAKPNASSALVEDQWAYSANLLPDLSSTYSSSTALAQPLQSSPSPRRHRHDTADRSALRGEFVNNLPRTHN